jgi:hypothetical protein
MNENKKTIEHKEALQWWKNQRKIRALCDYCCEKRLFRNQGYILKDIVVNIGGMKQVYKELLVCEDCFTLLKNNPRLPQPKVSRFHGRYELRVRRMGAEDEMLDGRIGTLSGSDPEFVKDMARSGLYDFEDPIVFDHKTGLTWRPDTERWEKC